VVTTPRENESLRKRVGVKGGEKNIGLNRGGVPPYFGEGKEVAHVVPYARKEKGQL